MEPMPIFYKDPDSTLDYSFRWDLELTDGDYVTASSWLPAAGLTYSDESLFVGLETDDVGDTRMVQRTTVFVAGGTVGQVYTVTNRVTTARGRLIDRSFELRIQEQ